MFYFASIYNAFYNVKQKGVNAIVNRSGRPKKSEMNNDSRNELISAAARIIAREGVGGLTVRAVCSEAGLSTGTFYYFFGDKNDLMMSFITDISFDGAELSCPLSDIGGRISELYMILVERYMRFGREFVRSFYNPCNKILSAYMGESEGKFASGTVMARSEQELMRAISEGIIILPENMTAHDIAADICTVIKGCVFEWCLNDSVDVKELSGRIIKSYLLGYIKKFPPEF